LSSVVLPEPVPPDTTTLQRTRPGSGKTTLLNCLTRYIDDDERVITCEDAAELQLQTRSSSSM
jgi:ABC-type branched-subunit amino acid transport system ATPase component